MSNIANELDNGNYCANIEIEFTDICMETIKAIYYVEYGKNYTKKYKKDNINFEVLDATKDSLPYADLIICKDLFLHLSLDNISLILKNIIDSKCKYFATSRYEGGSKGNNSNSSAQARPIEVTKDPFNFDYPIVSQFRYTIKSNLQDEIIIFKIN
mgnify:CR=1 FL=1